MDTVQLTLHSNLATLIKHLKLKAVGLWDPWLLRSTRGHHWLTRHSSGRRLCSSHDLARRGSTSQATISRRDPQSHSDPVLLAEIASPPACVENLDRQSAGYQALAHGVHHKLSYNKAPDAFPRTPPANCEHTYTPDQPVGVSLLSPPSSRPCSVHQRVCPSIFPICNPSVLPTPHRSLPSPTGVYN